MYESKRFVSINFCIVWCLLGSLRISWVIISSLFGETEWLKIKGSPVESCRYRMDFAGESIINKTIKNYHEKRNRNYEEPVSTKKIDHRL